MPRQPAPLPPPDRSTSQRGAVTVPANGNWFQFASERPDAGVGYPFRSSCNAWAQQHDLDQVPSEFPLSHIEGSAAVTAGRNCRAACFTRTTRCTSAVTPEPFANPAGRYANMSAVPLLTACSTWLWSPADRERPVRPKDRRRAVCRAIRKQSRRSRRSVRRRCRSTRRTHGSERGMATSVNRRSRRFSGSGARPSCLCRPEAVLATGYSRAQTDAPDPPVPRDGRGSPSAPAERVAATGPARREVPVGRDGPVVC